MAFGVFIHRSDSIYDDSPAERYKFPSQYLTRVRACIGDCVIYYEPRKVSETRGYLPLPKVLSVMPDPVVANMYVAIIEAGSYLEFVSPVPFSGADGITERGVLNEAGRVSGRAQSAVRPVSAQDFNRIIDLGLATDSSALPRVDEALPASEMREEQMPFQHRQERSRISFISSRTVRDRVFRRIVLQAYDDRCAITD
jgi:putative restriction endonuclease